MDKANVKTVLSEISKRHLECPICSERFNDPKILDCFHSFCLNCLDEFVKEQDPSTDKISCPVCRRETTIPATGLKDLSNCFFLSSLVDEVTEQERLLDDISRPTLTCEQCEKGLKAVSRCFDCDKNICRKCQENHLDSRSKTNHRTISLEDLTKIGASLQHPRKFTAPRCPKHTEQEIIFYCDTCAVLTCGRCAATDHRTYDHNYFEVTDFAHSFREDIQAAVQRFERSRNHFKEVEESLGNARKRLKTMVTKACRDISDKEEAEIAKIRNKACLLKEKVTQIGKDRDLDNEKAQVSNRNKMERAEQVMAAVNDLVQQADDFKLLGLKPKVVQNLHLTGELRFEPAQHDRSFIGVKCHDVVHEADLGDVLCEGKWEFKVHFGKEGTARGQFKLASCANCFSNGDIVVTDRVNKRASVFTSDRRYKTKVGQLKDPWGVAVTRDDLLVISDRDTVKVFDSNLQLTYQFTPSQSKGNYLGGIAVDKTKRIAVTDAKRKVITLHYPDGSLIATITNDMVGFFVAISDDERLIFTNFDKSRLLCVDFRGNELFNIGVSVDGISVRPRGVCCDDTGDVYVVVYTDLVGQSQVLHYSAQGEYKGIVAKRLKNPVDVTFTPRGDLVVTDEFSVKTFHWV